VYITKILPDVHILGILDCRGWCRCWRICRRGRQL